MTYLHRSVTWSVGYWRIIGNSARRRRTSDVTCKTKLMNLHGSRGQKKILKLPKIFIYHALFDFIIIKKTIFIPFMVL